MLCVEIKGNMGKKEKKRKGKDLKEKGFGAGQKPTVYRPRHERMEDVGR